MSPFVEGVVTGRRACVSWVVNWLNMNAKLIILFAVFEETINGETKSMYDITLNFD